MIPPYALILLLLSSGACQATDTQVENVHIRVVTCPVVITPPQPPPAADDEDEREELAPVDPVPGRKRLFDG